MSSPRPLALCAAALFAASIPFASRSLAQNVTTTPVGAMVYTIAGGTIAAPVTTGIAIPLKDTAAPTTGIARGIISSFTATTVTVASANWTTNDLSNASAPWLLRVRSGTYSGALLDIASNTGDTITIASGPDLTTFGLTAGSSSFELIPVDTLNTFFGANTLLGGPNGNEADNVAITSGGTTLCYYYDTTYSYWRRAGSSSTANRNNTQLRPDSAIRILRRASTTSLTVIGSVPDDTVRFSTSNSGTTVIHTGFPVDTTLAGFAAQNSMSNWRSGTDSNNCDQIGLLSGGTWIMYYYNSSNGYWRRAGSSSTTNRDTVAITAGTPVMVFRPVGLSTGNTYLAKAIPYSL